MKKNKLKSLKTQQKGIVSIMVTIIIMFVISLIVLGFARIVRREQRQALDRQLSTQAFYAAETGINDALKALKGGLNTNKETCPPDGSSHFPSASNELDMTAGILYTCLLIDQSPPSLEYTIDPSENARVVPIRAASGNITELKFSWDDTTPGTNAGGCPAVGNFPRSVTWPSSTCNSGVVRIDLVPTPTTSSVDRAALIDNVFTAFLYPKASGTGEVDYALSRGFGTTIPGSEAQGKVVEAKCEAPPVAGPRFCNVRIVGLNSDRYHVRIKTIYKQAKITILARTATGDTDLIGSQAVIDSTGKANDVLRRLQVHVPLGDTNNDVFPEFAIQSYETLCKRMRITAAGGVAFDTAADPACGL
jgi:hypothetical protein